MLDELSVLTEINLDQLKLKKDAINKVIKDYSSYTTFSSFNDRFHIVDGLWS